MTSDRFFIRKDTIKDSLGVLSGGEHHHLSRVARIRVGDTIHLFDEQGVGYLARVESIGREETRLRILHKIEDKTSGVPVVLGFGLLKQKSLETVLQKGVELGVSAFCPFQSSRSVVRLRPGDWEEKKSKRWRTILLSAAKQCGRTRLPEILEPLPLKDVILGREEEKKLFLSERGGRPLREVLSPRPRSCIVLVGPEGGWTRNEEHDIVKSGFEAVSLGDRTLRADTAALTVLAVFSQFWID